MREEWTSIVAHDLRQPITIVTLTAAALSKRYAARPSDGDAKLVERIGSAAARLSRMIDDLLDASRIEANRLDIQPRELDLPRLVAEVVDRAPNTAGRCVVSVQPLGEIHVFADPERIEQVLSNLLSNAVKYGDAGTDIHVDVASRNDHVEVTVTNRGRGITAPELALLFSRFSRSREARAGGTPGLGLGLYISRGLIEAQGGRMWVKSVPGAETSFHFTLPRGPGEGERSVAPPSAREQRDARDRHARTTAPPR